MTTILRPLSASELLDRTFHLYRNNFLVFVGITAIPQLFILPLMLGGAAMTARHLESTSIAMIVAGYLLYYLAVFVSQAPTISAVSNLHLEKPITIGSAYSSARRSLLRVIWIVFLIFLVMIGLLIIAGMLVGAVVGALAAAKLGPWVTGTAVFLIVVTVAFVILRWMVNWSLVIPVTVLEGGWFRTSVRRSKSLAKDSRWRIFGLYFLLGLLGGVTSLMVQIFLLLLVPVFGLRDYQRIQAATQAMQAIGIFISTSLVGALGTIALSLVYYDQRVRKEGFDLQFMIATLEGTTSQNPAAAPAL
jgi:hypothetical protein